jgi:predicted nucleic acid-binding Zn ribbon protein
VNAVERFSTLTCPDCGAQERREMPVDACLFFHECPACGARLKPLAGDCCVFCSFGD